MLSPAFSKVREFLGSWQNLIALGSLLALGVWLYNRVWMVNPAILGDEYLYSMNARKVGPWDPPVAGDFSNYLFNLVYQSTNFCGDAFYSCAKILNIGFFLGFAFILFVVALRFVPFLAALGFMVAVGLSPLSVYTSMFLPESMFFFFIGIVFLLSLRAIADFTWQNWGAVGLAVGSASLVKPHIWLSALAIGITLLVVGLSNSRIGLRNTTLASAALAFGAVLSRVGLGFVVAGPKALDFFGQYLRGDTLDPLTGGGSDESTIGSPDPLAGVAELFAPQLGVHLLTITALMSFSLAAVLMGVARIFRTRSLDPASAMALLSLVWLGTLVIEIVIFTGWVTGLGDDHSTRVLLRYYEFLFALVPLAGLAVLAQHSPDKEHSVVRWTIAGGLGFAMTAAFSGFFASLSIQIADAPTLAGLVVDNTVFSLASTLGLFALVLLASFPSISKWMYVVVLPVTMVATGYQAQEQYQIARGELSAADRAGQYVSENFVPSSVREALVLSASRFEATSVAFQLDEPEIKYEILPQGSIFPTEGAPVNPKIIIATNQIEVAGMYEKSYAGDGFQIYILGD